MLYCFTLHYINVPKFDAELLNDALFKAALFNVSVFDLVLLNVALFFAALFKLHSFNVSFNSVFYY